MNKLKTSVRYTDDYSIGFYRDWNGRQRELTNKKIRKVDFILELCLMMYSISPNTKKATYGLGCKLTIKRNSNNSVLIKANATDFGKIGSKSIESYLPHYIPSIPQKVHYLSRP